MVFISDHSGRFTTDYRPSCVADQQIKTENGITDNYNFRLFLQRNALKIMDKDRQVIIQQGCRKCKNCVLNNLQK
jgi:hypothetical protein